MWDGQGERTLHHKYDADISRGPTGTTRGQRLVRRTMVGNRRVLAREHAIVVCTPPTSDRSIDYAEAQWARDVRVHQRRCGTQACGRGSRYTHRHFSGAEILQPAVPDRVCSFELRCESIVATGRAAREFAQVSAATRQPTGCRPGSALADPGISTVL